MASNEKIYNTIQRYLNEEMDPEELKKFQDAMAADPALAEEVQLQQDMQELLEDSPENQLRHNLQKLSDEAKDPFSSVKSSKLWYLLWLIPVLLIALGWVIFSEPKNKDANAQEAIEQSIDAPMEESNQAPSETEILPEEDTQTNDPVPAIKPTTIPPSTPDKKESPPIAGNFEPTPALEFLIGNNVRANDLSIKVVQQQEDVELASQSELVDFQFMAQITTSQNLLKKTFKLHLFDNNPEAFGNFEPIHSIDLELVKDPDQSTYIINTQKKIPLKPGLYYQVLEEYEEERIHWAGKFMITKDK